MIVEHDSEQVHRGFHDCGVPVERRIAFVLSDFCDLLGVAVPLIRCSHVVWGSRLQISSARGPAATSTKANRVSIASLSVSVATTSDCADLTAPPCAERNCIGYTA